MSENPEKTKHDKSSAEDVGLSGEMQWLSCVANLASQLAANPSQSLLSVFSGQKAQLKTTGQVRVCILSGECVSCKFVAFGGCLAKFELA